MSGKEIQLSQSSLNCLNAKAESLDCKPVELLEAFLYYFGPARYNNDLQKMINEYKAYCAKYGHS